MSLSWDPRPAPPPRSPLAQWREVLPEAGTVSMIAAASTPGPTGFAKIKWYHLLHVPLPLKQVIKGKWGTCKQMEES